jgi:pterin-4a-carbinolamine dehydratase
MLLHKNNYDKSPKYMGQNFSKARDLHHHPTRGKHYKCVVPNINGMTSTTFYDNAIKDLKKKLSYRIISITRIFFGVY